MWLYRGGSAMRKVLFSVLGSGVIVLALGTGTSAVMATITTTWTIKPGGTVTGTAGTITVTDTTTGAQATCTSSSFEATLRSGTGKINPLGKITAVAYNSCSALGFGETITASASSTNPWRLRGGTYSSGVMHGSIGFVQTSFSISSPLGACTGTVGGTSATTPGRIRVTYKNVNGSLIMRGGNLHAWNVTGGCNGNINTGDPLTVLGTYKISPRQTITSP
jgi:hypothetical protein